MPAIRLDPRLQAFPDIFTDYPVRFTGEKKPDFGKLRRNQGNGVDEIIDPLFFGKARSKSERDAYAALYRKAPLAQTYDPRWSVWAAGFGGSQSTDGNFALGSNGATSRLSLSKSGRQLSITIAGTDRKTGKPVTWVQIALKKG